MIARYRRKRGHVAEPSYNFANSPYPFVLISVWVCAVATTGRSCLIRHDAARVWVESEDLQLPAGVHYGTHVAVIGNLKTFNVSGGFHVVKACLLGVSPQAMINAALEKYPDAVIHRVARKFRQIRPSGLRVRLKTLLRIAKFSQHEADGRKF
jgi:hypothetical protein